MNVHWPLVWKSSDLSMLTWQIVTIILVLCTITLWPVTCRRMSWLYNAICLKKRESENVDVAKLRSVLIMLWAVTIRLWAFFHPCLFTSSLSSSAEACCFNVLARRHIRTQVRATTDAHYEENGLAFNVFFHALMQHRIYHALYIPHIM